MRHTAFSIVLAVLIAMPVAAEESAPAQQSSGRLRVDTSLHPSKVTYRVSLLSGTAQQQFASAEGSFTDKSVLSCEGWNVEQRLFVKFLPPSKPGVATIPVYLRTGANNFESRDGLTYRFEDKTSMAGQVINSHKGSATLTGVGQAGTAVYTEPAGVTIELPAGTIFPVTYAQQLINAAGEGQPRYSARVFDGSMSAELGLIRMVTDISAPRAAVFKDPEANKPTPGLENEFTTELAWGMRTSMFKGNDANPLFKQGFSMLPNGRSETMMMNFGQFSLRFDLVKYEEIPLPTCP